jgi:hypothetical protein
VRIFTRCCRRELFAVEHDHLLERSAGAIHTCDVEANRSRSASIVRGCVDRRDS